MIAHYGDSMGQWLNAAGFLSEKVEQANVLLMEFELPDHAGSLEPLLKIIEKYRINITYINSEENKTAYQYFKMGLYIDKPEVVNSFLFEAAQYCTTRILEYDPTEKILDNTVFYLSFAEEVGEKLGLDKNEKHALILESNRIMQMLDDKNELPFKTFEFIADFAQMIAKAKGENFKPRITVKKLDEETTLTLIEPDCGSNTYFIRRGDKLFFVDSGFECYKNEMLRLLRFLIPDFDKMDKSLILTHSDTDHCGLMDLFPRVYLSRLSYEDFLLRKKHLPCYREQNPAHAPYSRISDILTKRSIPQLSNAVVIDPKENEPKPMEKIGFVTFEGIGLDIYAGSGGHIKGEILIYCEKYSLIFTGDVFVNLNGFTPEQKAFNEIAPFLMTNVDTNAKEASDFRKLFLKSIAGKGYTLCGGHGTFYKY